MVNVFDYSEYRKFLTDYYTEKKKAVPSFSYMSFARKAGFSNKGFINNVIAGRKNLSKNSIMRLCKAIGFNRYEEEYFENCVFFNQAKELSDRNHYFQRMISVKTRGVLQTKAHQMMSDQFEFYSAWYHSVIRSLIDMFPFKGDYLWLARKVKPQISVVQAKKSVALLKKLGVVKINRQGIYVLDNRAITTGSNVRDLAVLNLHKETIRLATDALETMSREKNITGITIGISDEMYLQICDEIKEFRAHLVNMINKDKKSYRVYQLNFHLFPMSDSNSEDVFHD